MWAISQRGAVITYEVLNAKVDPVRGEIVDHDFVSETRPALIVQMGLSDNIVQAGLVPAGSLRVYIDDIFDCKVGDRIIYENQIFDVTNVNHIDRAGAYELILTGSVKLLELHQVITEQENINEKLQFISKALNDAESLNENLQLSTSEVDFAINSVDNVSIQESPVYNLYSPPFEWDSSKWALAEFS